MLSGGRRPGSTPGIPTMFNKNNLFSMRNFLFLVFSVYLLFGCTINSDKEVDLSAFKESVVSKKEVYNGKGYFYLNVKGKKQEIQKDSFYVQRVCVSKVDYEKYCVSDTIK